MGKEVEIRLFTTLDSSGPFEFNIPSTAEYTLLPFTRLHGTSQIVNKDGVPVMDDIDFSVANLFPQTIFSQMDLEIGGTNLSCQDNLYMYKSYLETLLSYGYDAKVSALSTSHFIKDTAHNFENGREGNDGYTKRSKIVSGGKIFDWSIIPHVDFFHTPRVLPPNVGMKLKLTRALDGFSIISKEHTDLCVKIHSLNLYVYRLQPTDAIRRAHDKMFLKQNALFPITRSLCKKYTIPNGLSTAHQPNIVNGGGYRDK